MSGCDSNICFRTHFYCKLFERKTHKNKIKLYLIENCNKMGGSCLT